MSIAPVSDSQICAECGSIHYQNAKPCAGALIVRNGRILLARRVSEPHKGPGISQAAS